jgi:hypothetical protein
MEPIKKIGTITLDTGLLVLCDPSYLRYWVQDRFEGIRRYEDTQTGQIYTYGQDFRSFQEVLLDGKSVQALIDEDRLVRIPYEESGDFSHSSILKSILNKGYAQCHFPEGFEDMAVAVGAAGGDGEVPVFAEFKDGLVSKLWIDFEQREVEG